MNRKRLPLILVLVASLLLVSTVAYAYITPHISSWSGDSQALSPKPKQVKVAQPEAVPAGQTVPEQTPAEQTPTQQTPTQQTPTQQTPTQQSPTEQTPTQQNPNKKTVPPKQVKPNSQSLAAILQAKGIAYPIPGLKIVVQKSDHLLTLYSGASPLKTYKVAIGEGGLQDKQVSGDHKTPEGTFYIAERSVLSPADQFLGTRWMRVSYPNIEDAGRGLNSGIIDQAVFNSIVRATDNRQIPPQKTALGGGVGIHGGSDTNGPGDWTWGCVGLYNVDVEEIFEYISVGTPLVIQH